MGIDEQTKITLNGARQFVSIRAEKENAPLLLYLHGGPGDAALPLVRTYNAELEKTFTVAVWEQRGAGKSYYKFGPDEDITIELFTRDLYELVSYLLERFRQDTLVLVSHSWGSVLGLRFIREHPEIIRAYVGCGQVVNMKKSCRTAYDFALAYADSKEMSRLRDIDPAYTGPNWMRDLLYVTGLVVRYKGSLYGESGYGKLVRPFLFSRCYSPADAVKRQLGGIQSIRRLWPELMHTDFEGITHYKTPITFIEGRYDSHVSSELARSYFDTIETEKSFYWFERSCHFPQWSENGRFNGLMAELFSQPPFEGQGRS